MTINGPQEKNKARTVWFSYILNCFFALWEAYGSASNSESAEHVFINSFGLYIFAYISQNVVNLFVLVPVDLQSVLGFSSS